EDHCVTRTRERRNRIVTHRDGLHLIFRRIATGINQTPGTRDHMRAFTWAGHSHVIIGGDIDAQGTIVHRVEDFSGKLRISIIVAGGIGVYRGVAWTSKGWIRLITSRDQHLLTCERIATGIFYAESIDDPPV